MSKWGINFAISLSALAVGCVREDSILVEDGIPFSKNIGSLSLQFDGADSIVVRNKEKYLRIHARVPATIRLSPRRTRLVLNFGSGSGQVLELESYDLHSMQQTSMSKFEEMVVKATQKARCDIKNDEISYVAKEWRNENSLRIVTENWSRRSACPALDRDWVVEI